jgi:hypothetical protein
MQRFTPLVPRSVVNPSKGLMTIESHGRVMVSRRTGRARSVNVDAPPASPIQFVVSQTMSQLQRTRPLFVLAGIASTLTVTVLALMHWL